MHRLPRTASVAALALLAVGAVLGPARLPEAEAVPASPAATRLADRIDDVRAAAGHRYGTTDDAGHGMDAAEIQQAPDGTYLAVYHSVLADGRFHAAVATSADLLHWERRHDFGPGTSQPTLARDDAAGYVMAWEKDPHNHIAVRAYPTLDALLTGRAARAYDAPRTLSRCAEGTPSIGRVRGDTVELTGHYRAACDTDRELRATLTGFRTWRAVPDRALDTALENWGNTGNIGDRDPAGGSLLLVEGQRRRNDFGTWRSYVYDARTGRADRLDIRTHGGSRAFANPSVSRVTAPDGRPALVVGLFVPREGSAPGEAGQLLYWQYV